MAHSVSQDGSQLGPFIKIHRKLHIVMVHFTEYKLHFNKPSFTDVEAKAPIFGPPDAKSWPIWKDPDAGKDWGQEEKGTAEDEMVG